MSENWKPLPDWEDRYEVSDLGRVRSVTREVFDRLGRRRSELGRVLAQHVHRTGYVDVILFRDDQRHPRRVHTLVLTAFVGPRTTGMQGCHNNGVKTNNTLANLRWDTASANTRDQVKHGVHNMARKTHCIRGHEFTPENTQWNNRGDRQCTECRRIRRARTAADRKAAESA